MKRFIFLITILLGSTCFVQSQNLSELLTKLNQAKEDDEKIELYSQIGHLYQKTEAYSKAVEYFEKAVELEKDRADKKYYEANLKSLGNSYSKLKDYDRATDAYQRVLFFEKRNRKVADEILSLNELARLSKLKGSTTEAIRYTSQLSEIYINQNDLHNLANTYNNMGYLYRQSGDTQKSIEYFNKALETNKKVEREKDKNKSKPQVFTLLNMGVTYTNLGDFKSADSYYNSALNLAESHNNQLEIATCYNYMAANYYIFNKDNYAFDRVNKAIAIAEPNNYQDVLEVSYKLLSDLHQKDGDYKQSQLYYKKYQDMVNSMAVEERKKEQDLLQTQIEIEKKENELKMLIADKERQDLELERFKLESEKKEQELAILKQNQELQQSALKNQQLEKDKVQQLLEITKQKAEAERAQKEKDILQKNKALQDALLKQQDAEAKRKQKENELLKKEAVLQDAQLEQQRKQKLYITIGLVLMGIIALLVLAGLIQNRRQNKKLAKQNDEIKTQSIEIQSKNEELQIQSEELHQQQEEIMAQRDFIEKKNEELNEQNEKISQSINAALTIQQAILPYDERLKNIFEGYFVLYKPKDVVSGDFYWVEQLEKNIFAAAVDCTGHGVPGAFMSLIGSSLLDNIVKVKKIQQPSEILEELDRDVRLALKQSQTGNNNGMDLCLVKIEKIDEEKRKITFSGAKRPLYVVSVESEQITLKVLKGDRKSIGGVFIDDLVFSDQEVIVNKGSLVYLGSDGLTDQNNLQRKKFGEKRLLTFIENHARKPLNEQKIALESVLNTFQRGTTQRDDMVLLCIKV